MVCRVILKIYQGFRWVKAITVLPVKSQCQHASFTGCALVRKQTSTLLEEFDLVCANPEAASGGVRFSIGDKTFHGTLKIKMGGKNMKFSQQIHGSRIGAC